MQSKDYNKEQATVVRKCSFAMKSLESQKFQKLLTKPIHYVTQPPIVPVTSGLLLSISLSNENVLQPVKDDLIGDARIVFREPNIDRLRNLNVHSNLFHLDF